MQLHRARWHSLSPPERERLLARPARHDPELDAAVRRIIAAVRQGGDAAVRDFTRRFDRVEIEQLEVPKAALQDALGDLDSDSRSALERAIAQLRAFHLPQLPQVQVIETSPGVRCWREARPIRRVGLYVPGGRVALPSTLLMLAVPAQIAGCSLRVVCTPPGRDGRVCSSVLAAAALCGIERVFAVGGAQAVAAMAYGTQSIPKVDKVFGPGNPWVQRTKLAVAGDPAGAACDLPAGPSELLVIADAAADPELVAADLLSQAEHGPDSQVLLVTSAPELADAVEQALARQLSDLPRAVIAEQSLAHCRIILATDLEQAFEISNSYAPEHLILQIENAESWAPRVHDAGAVFLGAWSPEAAGDYASGPNHVLPTHGFARTSSGLGVESFIKLMSFQSLSPTGLRELGPTVERLARLEGLEAHRRAVSLRLAKLSTAAC